MITRYSERSIRLFGLSTDVKPTQLIENGSEFFEIDTKKTYCFDGQNKQWYEKKTSQDSGEQPQLFPPIIYGGYNTISWTTSLQNGDFDVITQASIDQEIIEGNSLIITAEQDNKHLIVTSSAANFKSSNQDILIHHMTAQESLLAVSSGESNSSYGLCVELSDIDALVPQGYESSDSGKYYSYKVSTDETGAGSSQLSFSVAAISSARPTTFKVSVVKSNNQDAMGTANLTIMKNGVEAINISQSSPIFEIPDEFTWELNDDIEFIVNATIVPAPPVAKGDLLQIDLNGDGTKERYRVFRVDGNNVEIVAMTNAATSTFGSSQVYENSTLDTYLNTTWYNTLSDTAKNAIVDKTFRQQSWYWGASGDPDYSGYYGSTKPGTTAYTISLGNSSFGNQITRHVYALAVQDVLDYVLDTTITDGQLQNYNIWKMLWNDEVTHGEYPWTRDASAGSSSRAMYVNGGRGYVIDLSISNSDAARPALTIDISKIEFEKE